MSGAAAGNTLGYRISAMEETTDLFCKDISYHTVAIIATTVMDT